MYGNILLVFIDQQCISALEARQNWSKRIEEGDKLVIGFIINAYQAKLSLPRRNCDIPILG